MEEAAEKSIMPPEEETEEDREVKPEEKKDQKKHRSPMTPIQVFLFNLLIIITVLWLLFGYVIGVTVAPNDNMAPNIKSKDMMLYYRMENTFHAQDVVVLTKNNTNYIGRIVAVAGDRVEISDQDILFINGNHVSEPMIHSPTPRFEGFIKYPVELGEDEYFVLADARSGAEDSRYFGAVRRNEIQGKVITVIRRNGI